MNWLPYLKRRASAIADAMIRFARLHKVRSAWMYTVRIVERMSDDHLFLSAAGIAFDTLLCLVPLTLLLFYVLGVYLDSASAMQTIYAYIDNLNLFPVQQEQLKEIVTTVLQEFIDGSGIAGIVGAVGLVYAASVLFGAIRTSFDKIFSFRDTKNLIVSKLKDFALLSILGIMVVVINITLIIVAFVQGLGGEVVWFQTVLSHVVSIVLPFIGFMIVYWMIPDGRLPWRAILLASVVAALLWAAARLGFEYYIKHFWRMGNIYGSYGILVMAAIWIYYSSLTLLVAAEIGEMYVERKTMKKLFTDEALQQLQRMIHMHEDELKEKL